MVGMIEYDQFNKVSTGHGGRGVRRRSGFLEVIVESSETIHRITAGDLFERVQAVANGLLDGEGERKISWYPGNVGVMNFTHLAFDGQQRQDPMRRITDLICGSGVPQRLICDLAGSEINPDWARRSEDGVYAAGLFLQAYTRQIADTVVNSVYALDK